MNRQLKIWKDDFLRYYGGTSIITRMTIGAVLSFLLAYLLISRIIRPQNKAVRELKEKYQAMEIIEDADLQVADLKNKQRKALMQLDGLKTENARLALEVSKMTKGDIGRNIIDLRYFVDKNNLRIVSEERVVPEKPRRGRGQRKNEIDTRMKISFPDSMQFESHRFSVLGSYRDLQKFLMDVRNAREVFFINNVSIAQSREMLTDRNLNQYRALSCTFEVHVPYLAETVKGGGGR